MYFRNETSIILELKLLSIALEAGYKYDKNYEWQGFEIAVNYCYTENTILSKKIKKMNISPSLHSE